MWNQQHITKTEDLKEWCAKKLAYLQDREKCNSTVDARTHLNDFAQYKGETNDQLNSAVPSLKGLGQNIRGTKNVLIHILHLSHEM